MCEDEDRCVKRRGGAPCALPIRLLGPPRRAVLPRPPDLRARPHNEKIGEGRGDAASPAGLLAGPPPGGEHPLVQPVAGVAERCLAGLTFPRAETVERDGEVLDEGA